VLVIILLSNFLCTSSIFTLQVNKFPKILKSKDFKTKQLMSNIFFRFRFRLFLDFTDNSWNWLIEASLKPHLFCCQNNWKDYLVVEIFIEPRWTGAGGGGLKKLHKRFWYNFSTSGTSFFGACSRIWKLDFSGYCFLQLTFENTLITGLESYLNLTIFLFSQFCQIRFTMTLSNLKKKLKNLTWNTYGRYQRFCYLPQIANKKCPQICSMLKLLNNSIKIAFLVFWLPSRSGIPKILSLKCTKLSRTWHDLASVDTAFPYKARKLKYWLLDHFLWIFPKPKPHLISKQKISMINQFL
jgi:hypothetical protein